MKNGKRIWYTVVFSVLAAVIVIFPVRAEGDSPGNGAEAVFSEFDTARIQEFLDGLQDGAAGNVSFMETMKLLVSGNLQEILSRTAEQIRQAIFSEIRMNSGLIGQVVLLAFTGAVFSNFAGIFGTGHVSEAGFYVIYLLTITFLAASFFASIRVADAVFQDIMEFMRALLPAWFLAVAMAGGAVTSSAMCGFTFAAIGLVQSVFSGILVPLMRVYMMLVLAGNLYREDMISRMTGLLKLFIEWTMKALFGVVVGFHIIQGMVLPQADALKNASVVRLAQMIPGLGQGAGAVSQMVMGSGILIKNTAGAAAIVILLLMAAIPVMKLLALVFLYEIASAIMQPVCDRRLVACMSETAEGHRILLKMVGYSLALFGVTIALLCVFTNASWYAG